MTQKNKKFNGRNGVKWFAGGIYYLSIAKLRLYSALYIKWPWRVWLVLRVSSFFIFVYLLLFAAAAQSAANQQAFNFNHLDLLKAPSQSVSELTMTVTKKKAQLIVTWEIPKGQYLYRDKIFVKGVDAPDLTVGDIVFPPALAHPVDNEAVYQNILQITVPLSGTLLEESKLQIGYQGCTNNICFLPQVKTVSLDESVLPVSGLPFNWLGILALLGIGILLAFTPCVLPMVPIITAIVMGKSTSRTHGVLLAISYVLGMALMYSLLGVIISTVGLSFQLFFQQGWVIYLMALVFILLALSMFGLFQLALPSGITQKLHYLQSKLQTGSVVASFLMGVLASLVLSPCTSAPLIAVLGTMAQTGDVLYGALSLFALGIGMGVPLIFIALGLNRFVPRSGAWMNEVKVFFGMAMLAMAIYILSRVILSSTVIYILSLILIAAYILYFVLLSTLSDKLKRAHKLYLILITLILFIAAMSVLLTKSLTDNHAQSLNAGNITTVYSISELDKAKLYAQKKHQYILVDYYASWCTNCVALKEVLTSREMTAFFANKNIKVIEVNVTDYDEQSKALLNKAKVLGLPTLRLISSKDNAELVRLSGKLAKDELKGKITAHMK